MPYAVEMNPYHLLLERAYKLACFGAPLRSILCMLFFGDKILLVSRVLKPAFSKKFVKIS